MVMMQEGDFNGAKLQTFHELGNMWGLSPHLSIYIGFTE